MVYMRRTPFGIFSHSIVEQTPIIVISLHQTRYLRRNSQDTKTKFPPPIRLPNERFSDGSNTSAIPDEIAGIVVKMQVCQTQSLYEP
jgi:hypothetical protein